ncbi:MAG TPA: DUF4383 domain-containing protein [Pseudonocardiaceae bacterium]|nr:DUF4383 domain-containing protein [Pseudonocardiaceae bacterium]
MVAIHPGEARTTLFTAFTGLEQGIGSIVRRVSSTPPGRRLDFVHRVGAAVLGAGLCLFGVLGVAGRLEFLAVRGPVIMGLATNGLLATISLIVGGVLIGAAFRGGRSSSTITVVIGVLFLLSGLLNLFVLDTAFNLLAFRLSNVIFSFIAGMLLLFLGAYGRFSGGLPADNPYYQQRHRNDPRPAAGDAASVEAGLDDAELAGAELAVAEGHATPEQELLVLDDARRRAAQAHRHAWEVYHSGRAREANAPVPPYWRGASYRPWSRGAKPRSRKRVD